MKRSWMPFHPTNLEDQDIHMFFKISLSWQKMEEVLVFIGSLEYLTEVEEKSFKEDIDS